MRLFFDWFSEEVRPEEPWLILGKGPSFSLRDRFDLDPYHLFSLNHVVGEQAVKIAHAIDIDVVVACADEIQANAECLVLPWIPHVDNRPGKKDLEQFLRELPVLRHLDGEGRLLWYNLSTAKEKRGHSPVVQVVSFSAAAAVDLLAKAGARHVRSLGVDGGTSYSREFGGLNGRTLLSNGKDSFDQQFKGIARTRMSTGVDYAPLHVESPIRVYIGSQEAQDLAVKVLEYSIHKHASMNVEVFPLHHADIQVPKPKDVANRPRTPFSFQRFYIPQLAGFRGRAIYLDSDMQVFKDIREVWTLPFDGADVLAARGRGSDGRKPQFAVMLLDCGRLEWDIDDVVAGLDRGEYDYEALMYTMAVAKEVRAAIDAEWNSLERYEEGKTALLHYTDMNTQPWISRDNRLGYLWMRDLIEAVDEGFITREYVEEQIERGHVRPSVLYQLDQRLEDGLLLPSEARALDKDFVPPYRKMSAHGVSPLRNPVKYARAFVRHLYQKSLLYKVVRRIVKGDAYPVRTRG